MPFSEKLKLEVKQKSNFKCVICGQAIVEVHHIIAQAENGTDTFENAVALCAHCHNIYGNNKLKREEIRRIRDNEYKRMEEKNLGKKIITIEKAEGTCKVAIDDEDNILMVRITERENFMQAARKIYSLLYDEGQRNPNAKRTLVIEIQGHRVKAGGYDRDMFELQSEFAFEVLMPVVHILHMPLISIENTKQQKNLEIRNLMICDSEEEMKEKQNDLEKKI